MLKTLQVLRRWCLNNKHVLCRWSLPKDLELLVMFQFLAGLLSTEPTVVLVGTGVSDAVQFISNLLFRIVLLQLMDATRAP